MIYQNDKDAHPTIKKYGCYYYSMLAAMFRAFPELGLLTHNFAISFWERELANNRADIRTDCLIENPQNLVDDLVGVGRVQFVGKMPVSYKPEPGDIVIQYWVTPKGQTHFTLHDYDPWYPASPWRTGGTLSGYRIFRVLP